MEGEGGRAGKVVEQQLGALGNPCSSFSPPSSLLCIRRGFDKSFTLGNAIHKLCAKIFTKRKETKLRIGLGLKPGESRWLAWTPNSKDHVDWTPCWRRDRLSSGLESR